MREIVHVYCGKHLSFKHTCMLGIVKFAEQHHNIEDEEKRAISTQV